MYQVRRAREHDGRLTLLEILLQRVGKLLTILHKLPLSLLQGMFTLKYELYRTQDKNLC